MTDGKTYEIDICGVPVSSRYGSASELKEMATFITGLFATYPHCVGTIKSVSCDSKTGQINIELNDDRVSDDPAELGGWGVALTNFYFEETGSARVVHFMTKKHSFEETPDIDVPGCDSSALDYTAPPPGTVMH